MALNVFRLLLVYARHGVAGPAVRVKQLVEFGLYGLSVAVLGSLNEEGHDPNDDGSNAVPVKRCRLKYEPGNGIGKDYQERQRMAAEDTKLSERAAG